MKKRLLKEKSIHLAFQVSLVLKASFAGRRASSGDRCSFVTQQFVFRLAERITRGSGSRTTRFNANHLVRSAQHFSVNTRNFTAL
jgi:uncharacterized membrane protein